MMRILLTCLVAFFCFTAGSFFGYITRNSPAPEQQATETDTVYIHNTDTVSFFVPVPRLVLSPEVPAVVDTAAIISDYYSRKIYSEFLVNTENLKLSLSDTVFQNVLQGRNLSYELTFPEITKTITATKKPAFSVSFLVDSRPSASIIAGYKSFFLQGGYDLELKQPFAGLGIKLYER